MGGCCNADTMTITMDLNPKPFNPGRPASIFMGQQKNASLFPTRRYAFPRFNTHVVSCPLPCSLSYQTRVKLNGRRRVGSCELQDPEAGTARRLVSCSSKPPPPPEKFICVAYLLFPVWHNKQFGPKTPLKSLGGGMEGGGSASS